MKQVKTNSFEEFMRRLRDSHSVGNGGTVTVGYINSGQGGDVLDIHLHAEAIVDDEQVKFCKPYHSAERAEFAILLREASENLNAMADEIKRAGFIVANIPWQASASGAAQRVVEMLEGFCKFMPPEVNASSKNIIYALFVAYTAALVEQGRVVNIGADRDFFHALQSETVKELLGHASAITDAAVAAGHVN